MPDYMNVERLFFPRISFTASRDHYGPDISDEEIIQRVYGGRDLTQLYESVTVAASQSDVLEVRATLTFNPRAGGLVESLILDGVSMRQFLVAGLPRPEWFQNGFIESNGLWRILEDDGTPIFTDDSDVTRNGRWTELDNQYALELCHSEVSRWSTFFKRDGTVMGGANITGHEQFSRIELINNCTSTRGFEVRLDYEGELYHASFGAENNLRPIYRALSRRQAGSIAEQGVDLPNAQSLAFFDFPPGIYGNSSGIGPDPAQQLNKSRTIAIQIPGRYRDPDSELPADPVPVTFNIERGPIDYLRWGSSNSRNEMYQKAIVRRLMWGIVSSQGRLSKSVPQTYEEIAHAQAVILPEFQQRGIYDFSQLRPKAGYRWLYEFDTCVYRELPVGRFELEFQRSKGSGRPELRRLVIGNIGNVPQYPDNLTVNRFGYGPRETIMDYDPTFVPPASDSATPAVYTYLLAGWTIADANLYITPESFGLERAILSRPSPFSTNDSNVIEMDLISFERILPVWQARITLPDSVTFEDADELDQRPFFLQRS